MNTKQKCPKPILPEGTSVTVTDNRPHRTFEIVYFYKDESDRDRFIEKFKQFDLSRVVLGDEVCPTTGRRHLQGKVTWLRAYRLTQLAKLVPHTAFKPSCSEDFNYGMKEELLLDRKESQQGARNDLRDAMLLVRQKKPRIDLMEAHPGTVARFGAFLNSYNAELNRYTGPRFVVWAHGETGAGKTFTFERFAELNSIEYASVEISGGGFFNGYQGEQYVIIDEFRHTLLPFSTLLKILDRYRHVVSVKGSFIPWNARLIYITAPMRPEDCYPTTEDVRQLLRRINVVAEFPTDADDVREALQGYFDSTAQSTAAGGSGESSSDVQGSSSST